MAARIYVSKMTEKCQMSDGKKINFEFDIETTLKSADIKIVVVPTIIVFNGKEVERFQANIMMAMEATRKDVQNVIDEILMSDF